MNKEIREEDIDVMPATKGALENKGLFDIQSSIL